METKEEKYARAVEHVHRVRKLYRKITKSVVIVVIVAAVNYYVDEFEHPWFLWVVGFSFLGIAIETFKVYGTSLFLGKGWEQRKIKEHMENEENDGRYSNTNTSR